MSDFIKNNKKILLVAPCSPYNPQSGAEQRTALLYAALQEIGVTDFIMINPNPSVCSSRIDQLDNDGRSELFWKASRFGINKYGVADLVYRNGAPFNIDLNDYFMIVGRYLNPICKLDIPGHVFSMVDLDDWDKSYGESKTLSLRVLFNSLKQKYAFWLSKKQLRRFDGFFFVSKRDLDKAPKVLAEVLPNIPFILPGKLPLENSSNNIIFVGALWYAPNFMGINHFLKKCWPTIRSNIPDATLTLAGSAPVDVRQKWEAVSGVKAPGFVEDLESAYDAASFSIAPIYFGGGTNIKILESLAFGRACVTTSHCAMAFRNDLIEKNGISVATSDTEFINLCLKMLRNKKFRTNQAVSGNQVVRENYSQDEFNRVVVRLSKKIMKKI